MTTPFSEAQLRDLLPQRGVFVAVAGEKIVGYVVAGSWAYFSRWEIFNMMTARLPLNFKEQSVGVENSFQYGPVCIDASWRGTGLFPRLFETVRLEFAGRFPVGLTFINQVNEHSIPRAHAQARHDGG